MNDFKSMAHILSAIKMCEREKRINMAYFNEKAIKTDEATRDSLIIKLQKEGYVDGFCIIDDIDNQTYPVILWNNSLPSITIKGLTFIEENKPLKEAIGILRNGIIGTAIDKVSEGIFLL